MDRSVGKTKYENRRDDYCESATWGRQYVTDYRRDANSKTEALLDYCVTVASVLRSC